MKLTVTEVLLVVLLFVSNHSLQFSHAYNGAGSRLSLRPLATKVFGGYYSDEGIPRSKLSGDQGDGRQSEGDDVQKVWGGIDKKPADADTKGTKGKGFGFAKEADSLLSQKKKKEIESIVPSKGTLNNEKFLMMYTCKVCNGRNAHMVSKVAYEEGMVVTTCR